ncbi:hypothetical protein KS527_004470 [Salmonella enterica]|nr:hypothetical protein [Salmonella enterica]
MHWYAVITIRTSELQAKEHLPGVVTQSRHHDFFGTDGVSAFNECYFAAAVDSGPES